MTGTCQVLSAPLPLGEGESDGTPRSYKSYSTYGSHQSPLPQGERGNEPPYAGLATNATSLLTGAVSALGSLTTRTEQGDSRITFSATLPINSRSRPVRPCVPITIRSMPASWAK